MPGAPLRRGSRRDRSGEAARHSLRSSFRAASASLPGWMAHKNERVELEMKIMKYRALARQAGDDVTRTRIKELVAELERKLREIDE
jgi:hypothetical protein